MEAMIKPENVTYNYGLILYLTYHQGDLQIGGPKENEEGSTDDTTVFKNLNGFLNSHTIESFPSWNVSEWSS